MAANIYLSTQLSTNPSIKLLIVAAHRPNRSPSQRFRFEQYLAFLQENGIQTTLSYIISEKDDQVLYAPGRLGRKFTILFKSYLKRWKDVLTCGRYDVVLVQREAIMTRTILFERLLAWRKPMIYDFDDAIWKMDVSDANQKLKWMKNPSKTARLIKMSKLVLAGNAYLQQYALLNNKNVWLLPTTVDTDVFKPSAEKKVGFPLTIGWSGSKTTIKHFEMAVPVLEKIREKYGDKVLFKVIGEPGYRNEKLGVQSVGWSSASEVSELNTIDIGIMPLPDDEWAKGKCGLKGLTYMALEIPTLMSAVGVNTEIIDHGVNGFLFSNNDDFYALLVELIEDAGLRKKLGEQGRQTVIGKYSVLANKQKYLDAIREAIGDRR